MEKTELGSRIVDLISTLPEAVQTAFAAGYGLGIGQTTDARPEADADESTEG